MLTIRNKIPLIFGVVAVVTLACVAAVYGMGLRVAQANFACLNSVQVSDNLDRILILLDDAETGQRGYLLTGDERYLEPYDDAVQEIHSRVELLKSLAQHGDLPPASVATVERLTQAKFQELAQTIALRRANRPETALEIVRSDLGKRVMDDLRAELADLNGAVTQEFTRRSRVRDQASMLRTVVAVVSGAVSLAFIFWAFRAIRRSTAALEEQRRTLAVSETNLRLYENVLAACGNAVVITDPAGTIEWVNAAFTRLTGYSAGEAMGKTMHLLSSGRQSPEFFRQLWQTIQAGRTWKGQLINRRKDGLLYHEEMTITPVCAKSGGKRITHFIAIKEDISERQRAEEALRQSTQRLHALFHEAALGIVEIDRDYRIVESNDRFCRMLDYSRQELHGKAIHEVTAPEDREQSLRLSVDLREGRRQRVDFEKRYLKRDGSPVWVRVAFNSLRDEKGDWAGAIGTVEDITARKHAEELLKLRESYLTSIIENQPGLIWLKDEEGRFLAVNSAFGLSCGGQSPEDLVGKTDLEIWPKDLAEKYRADDAKVIQGGKPLSVEEPIFDQGQTKWFETFKAPIYDETGKVIGTTGYARDITERKRAEERLLRAAQDLARSNQDLEQFGYIVSHDLQEPLRMVSSYVKLLEQRYQDQLDEDAHDFIHFAVDGAQRMSMLITDLLQLSRIGSQGKKPEPVALTEVVERAKENLKIAITEASAEITTEPLPVVRGDPTQLTQLFQNLIGNALKFRSPDRPATVCIGAEHINGQWRINIADQGIGIAPEHREKIFQVFKRLHTRKEYPGTGIGLAVCKKIVERHGGRIWVESQAGQGSTFYFTLQPV